MSTALRQHPVGASLPLGMVVASMVLFQAAAGLSRPLVAEVGALGFTWMRMTAAAVVLVLVTRPRLHEMDRKALLAALLLGSALAIMGAAYIAAANHLPLGLAATIAFLGPFSVAVLSSRGWQPMALSVLAGVGVLLSLEPWSAQTAGGWMVDPLGVGFAGLAAAGFAGYIVMSRRVGHVFQGSDGLAISVLTAAILLSPFGISSMQAVPSPGVVLPAAGLALMSPVLTCWLEMAALRRLGTQVFSVLLSLEPAIAAVLGIALLLEMPSPVQTIGICCVVIASIAVIRRRPDPA
jgi:inner membrane transporter RhtA